jgi:hypothetical protein
MRRRVISSIVAVLIFLIFCSTTAFGFDSGSTGADGALNPTSNTVIQLPASGVLNYTTVNIPTGVTVTFTGNASNTPVTMLATGDVTIAGTISVNGTNASGMYAGKGGPGGFDGGLGGTLNLQGGSGLGPGGGNPGTVSTSQLYEGGGGGGGGFGTAGSNGTGYSIYSSGGTGGGVYSNDQIIPLIGGSGGGAGAGSANSSNAQPGGGGGGGAGTILIASSGTINLTGSITANGGRGGNSGSIYAGAGAGGSGGAIKLMATTISGEGTISTNGGSAGTGGQTAGGAGGVGKIRLEAGTVTRTSQTTPVYTYGYPGAVFVTNVPTLTIISVAGVSVPSNPSGKFGSPDVVLPPSTTNPVTVNVSGSNIPVNTTVTVTAIPSNGGSTSASASLTGADASATTASVSINLSTSYQTIITAQATFTIQTAMYYNGEELEKVRVASTMGGKSETVYITKTGREIRAELLAGLMK